MASLTARTAPRDAGTEGLPATSTAVSRTPPCSTLEASTTCAIPRAMRFLLAGAVLIVLGLSLTEYTRRSALPASSTTTEAAEDTAPKKKQLPPKLAKLLELGTPDLNEPVAPADAALALLGSLKTDGAPVGGLTPLLAGDFTVRQLRAGFGYAVAAVDVGDGSALLRVEPGTPAKVLATRARRITALTLDASTLFFAEGGHVYTLSARGDGLLPRAVFPNATVTSLAASGDDLLLAVTPPGQADSTEGAVVRLDASGELTVLASDQARPRNVLTDGKEAFWLADGLWRAALDGAFASRIADGVDGPLALDGDALVVGAKGEVRRLSRAGGKAQVLAPLAAAALVTSSGLTRIATDEPAARLFDVTPGAEPTLSTTLTGPVSALALGGTTLFAVSKDAAGATVLLAK